MLLPSYDCEKKTCRNVFGHTYGHHDHQTELEEAANNTANVRIHVTLMRVRALMLPWKTSITYSECVSLALVIQQVMRMIYIVVCEKHVPTFS